MAERLPCARCKRIFRSRWYCELVVETGLFYKPVVEEQEHTARRYRGESARSVGVAQTEAGRPDAFRCCARCAREFYPDAKPFVNEK
eukprot:1805160-Lingulodinium_polyedra.AAC.1